MIPADRVRLRHMLEAAREAVSFTTGAGRADLDADRMRTLALVKAIEIVGEAAGKVTPETRQELPSLPWQQAISMRNRLIHGYFDIDLDVVWATATMELPRLIADLEATLDTMGEN